MTNRRWDDKTMADLCLEILHGVPVRDIAKDHGVSASRILQVFYKAMRKISILNGIQYPLFDIRSARSNADYWVDQIEKFKKEQVQ